MYVVIVTPAHHPVYGKGLNYWTRKTNIYLKYYLNVIPWLEYRRQSRYRRSSMVFLNPVCPIKQHIVRTRPCVGLSWQVLLQIDAKNVDPKKKRIFIFKRTF